MIKSSRGTVSPFYIIEYTTERPVKLQNQSQSKKEYNLNYYILFYWVLNIIFETRD